MDIALYTVPWRHRIGALVDHPEPEGFDHRHAVTQWNGVLAVVEFQPESAIGAVSAAQPDGHPGALAQFMQNPDIDMRILGGIARLIGCGERRAIITHHRRIGRRGHQNVAEIARQCVNIGFKFCTARLRGFSRNSADDHMHPYQFAFGEMRIEC